MGTRSGDIDPAIVNFIMEKENLSAKEVNDLLNKQSGVFGISELSSDFRDLEAGAAEGNENCVLALNKFFYEVAKYIGAYAAALNGIDVITFTAGVGENGPETREAICEYLGYLGVEIDPEANKARGKEVCISTPNSKVQVWVVPTNEELMIARDTMNIVQNEE